jgi:hypothetical protein
MSRFSATRASAPTAVPPASRRLSKRPFEWATRAFAHLPRTLKLTQSPIPDGPRRAHYSCHFSRGGSVVLVAAAGGNQAPLGPRPTGAQPPPPTPTDVASSGYGALCKDGHRLQPQDSIKAPRLGNRRRQRQACARVLSVSPLSLNVAALKFGLQETKRRRDGCWSPVGSAGVHEADLR